MMVEHHDGLVDIVNGSDNVQIINNKFLNHNKAILIGNSDKRISDKGKLNVLIQENYFYNISQRIPRVRYGNIRVYI